MILSVGGQKEKKSIFKNVKNSIAIGVWKENELIGFARVVSDGFSSVHRRCYRS